MHQHTESINTPNNLAPRFSQSQNVARTMSSREIADLVEARHNDVITTIERLFAKGLLRSDRKTRREATGGRPIDVYDLTERDTHLVVAGYSDEHRARVIDRWQELEGQVAQPQQLSTMDILQIAMESEKARMMLTAQVEQQATKIHSLENLFKEGMTHTQFCKGLNGVNVMQVGNYLEGRSWFYNESKSGTRHRVGSYARDKYMTEHQVEVTPHGKDPFISYTPVLLKKGAARLYDLYLAGELPMKKTWDGLFTHDKAMRGAA
ncbi:Rha family transcriptional regulator [Pseudomonas rhodesiae]|uniref:Rha family transcriptional regulator n=1 Tax=Pseudomonas rhodesiae TaxID=76760 RepID=UPI00209EA6D9|nr:Rha family transcriptional regulator [Pseudomonas rhodesiae]MCP1510990.1 phage regulator Rha-like protein [Pseudomonas rhodesiae]MDF9769808.1 phage regulator Rha-like protein [Pseudomonas rhodesiae]